MAKSLMRWCECVVCLGLLAATVLKLMSLASCDFFRTNFFIETIHCGIFTCCDGSEKCFSNPMLKTIQLEMMAAVLIGTTAMMLISFLIWSYITLGQKKNKNAAITACSLAFISGVCDIVALSTALWYATTRMSVFQTTASSSYVLSWIGVLLDLIAASTMAYYVKVHEHKTIA